MCATKIPHPTLPKTSLEKYFITAFIGAVMLFPLPFQANAYSGGAVLYAEYISVDALTLDNSNPEQDPTTSYIRGIRVCNLGDANATNVTVTWNWEDPSQAVDGHSNCSAELIYLVDTGDPETMSYDLDIATLPFCGTSCTTTHFFDVLDQEYFVSAGESGDPTAMPSYCYDFYFTIGMPTYMNDPLSDYGTIGSAKADRFIDHSGSCQDYAYNATNETGTGAPRRFFYLEVDSDQTTLFNMEQNTTYGDGVQHVMRGFQGTAPQSLDVAIKSIAATDGSVSWTDTDFSDSATPSVTFEAGKEYDVTVCGYTNGQIMVDLGVNFDPDYFEFYGITGTWDDTTPNPDEQPEVPTTGLFDNNADFWTFCEFVQDYADVQYGNCRCEFTYPCTTGGNNTVLGVYLNNNQDQNLKNASENLANCGIELTLRLRAKVDSVTGTALTPYIMGNAAGTSAEWKKNVGVSWDLEPTYASISGFKAEDIGGQTVVQWTTDMELGTVGFNLLRKGRNDKKFSQLNQDILLADPSAKGGSTYSFVDETAQVGDSYTYKIAEIDARGNSNFYGPFPVTIGKGSGKGKGFVKGFQRKAHPLSKEMKELNRAARDARKAAQLLKKKRSGDAAKIFVDKDGLYGLSTADIAGLLGKKPKSVKKLIDNGHLRLANKRRAVPLLAGADGVYFYGAGIDSLYTTDNVYWLTADAGPWLDDPAPASNTNINEDTGANFLRKTTAEENPVYLPQFYSDPEDDVWLWQSFYASSRYSTNIPPFSINVPDPATGNGTSTLAITLKGILSEDHHIEVALNGTKIGESSWTGTDLEIVEIGFDSGLLNNGENKITITPLFDGSKGFSYFYVDRFELTYPSLYRAVNDALEFTGDGNSLVTVTGFSSSDIIVLDVTDSAFPVAIPVTINNSGNGTYSATLNPVSPNRRYYAAATAQPPSDVYADAPSNLRQSVGASYVIISPSEFLTVAEDLAAMRQTSGLTTMVVDLEDVMDEFNDGIYSPFAIRDFLRYAKASWSTPPEYALLVGSASMDYKDYLGHGDNLMPTVVAATPFGLFGSDNYFADVTGDDGIPEIAIGRIPARTITELTAYVNKIAVLESVGAGQWSESVLLLADKTDDGGNFSASSDHVADLVPNHYITDKIYLPFSSGVARDQVVDKINNGVGFVNYFGHGAYNNLARNRLLRSSDVGRLDNSSALPIMSFMTCGAGWFELAGRRSLAEELALYDNGGAAAVWTASGASMNDLATTLDTAFFKAVFQDGEPTVGKAILKAKSAYGKNRYMLDIYNLMGDPALPIQ